MPCPEIGPDWLAVEAYAPTPEIAAARLLRWGTRAHADAVTAGATAALQ